MVKVALFMQLLYRQMVLRLPVVLVIIQYVYGD